MKRYIYGITALLMAMLAASALTACVDDNEPFEGLEAGSDCFTLVVNVPMEAYSRATDTSRATETEINNNEFKVTKLHLYFYKIAGHDDATSPSVYDYVWDGEDFNTTNKLTVPLPASALLPDGLFGGGATDTKCKVYAVANVDETVLPDGPQTINQLKATAVTSAFDQTKVQDFFAMDGQAEVTIDRTTRKATGTIELKRAAAKITLAVNLPETIEVTDVIYNQDGTTKPGDKHTYKPNSGSMHVWISNGVKNSKLNTDPDDASFTVAADDLYSNKIEAVDNNGSKFTYIDAMEKYKYIQNVPFYSYPNKWESDNPEGNCYLTLVLPWSYTDAEGKTQQVTTYYRIPVNPEACTIERNTHYDIRVTIGRLGSVKPQEPTDMEVEWNYAIPWNTNEQAVDIKQVRYLLLNNNYYDSTITNSDGSTTDVYTFEMNNTTDIEIPVGTSHDVEIASVTMSWIDYKNNPPQKRTITLTPNSEDYYKYSDIAGYTEDTKLSVFAGIEMDNTTSKLILKRELLHIVYNGEGEPKWVEDRYEWRRVNGNWQQVLVEPAHWEGGSTITENDALNSYTFDIMLWHADDASQTAMVHITQYPPIYITAEETPSGTRFVNKNNNSSNNNKGYVGDSPWEKTDLYLGSIHDDSYVKNKNTYIITISRFDADEEKEYIIADPRTRDVNNLPDNNIESQTDVAAWSMTDDNNKQLQYYYPGDNSGEKTRYIAPKIRIASQWGVTYDMTRKGAQRRCASYQENGRPAGRWRVPTFAEIEFIASLSTESYIPYLFDDSGDHIAEYWCASGAVEVNNNNKTVKEITNIPDGTIYAVRCVYDDWYWGDNILTGDAAEQFTWGDKQRTSSGN